jgi:hypothetical protein
VVAAQETSLREILEGAKQYRVPLYQRVYSWTDKQVDQLWDDIVETADNRLDHPKVTHFIGSLVLAATPDLGPVGLMKYLVVDGQQRLTTLTLLLAAIRDHLLDTGQDPSAAERIGYQYLINQWQEGQPKLLPTRANQDSYLAAINRSPNAGGEDGIGAAYRRLRGKLVELEVLAGEEPDDADSRVTVKDVESTILNGLALVSVTANGNDNVYRIFESLNNTGLKLTQADLLKNYLFMRLGDRSRAVYEAVWLPLESRLKPEELELLFWLDLVRTDEKARQSDTYEGQQRRLEKLTSVDQVEAEVRRIADLGALLETILKPEREPDAELRNRLRRFREWGTTTAYPIILELLRRRAAKMIETRDVVDALRVLESYFVRRIIVGKATANLNRTLVQAIPAIETADDVAESLRAHLSRRRRYFATNAQIREAVRTIPFYLQGRASQKKLILGWLEESLGSKEPVRFGKLSIEHVMPQTMSSEWRRTLEDELGPSADIDTAHSLAVHTIGNLTLTGYNSEMSNSPFSIKRERLRDSGLLMNHQIAGSTTWGIDEINRRSDLLADQIISIWPGPNEVFVENSAVDNPRTWAAVARLLAQIPAGRWTTCDAVALVAGIRPYLLREHLATVKVDHAHRVLDGGGGEIIRGSKAFLESEGVILDAGGRAPAEQFLSAEELAEAAGILIPETSEEKFEAQLKKYQSSETVEAVHRLMARWNEHGRITYGSSSLVTAFFTKEIEGDTIWPFALYPDGKVEVVFQYLASREPFTDEGLRQEFRRRLNEAPGISVADKPRPGFHVSVLADPVVFDIVQKTLNWFLEQVEASLTERI